MQNLIIHSFENYLWLIFGALVLLCFGLLLFTKGQRSNFISEDILAQVYGKNSYWYSTYIVLLILITSLFFIVLAGPQNEKQLDAIQKNGIDIEIVFDVSHSMIAEDLLPSRVDVAKSVVSDFIRGTQSDRIGLILFAGKAFQSIPLSYDYDFLIEFVDDMSIETIDSQNPNLQGTAIGDALILAADALLDKEKQREKIIILITDGTANKGVTPEIAMKLLQDRKIKTYTIGVGKKESTTIDVVVGPGFTQRIDIPGVDEVALQNISELTGGTYFRADSQGAFTSILNTIGKLEKSELEVQVITFNSSQRKIFIYILLLSFIFLGYIVFIKKIQL